MVFTSSFCLFSLGRVAFKEKGGSLAGPKVFHKEKKERDWLPGDDFTFNVVSFIFFCLFLVCVAFRERGYHWLDLCMLF